MNTLVSDLLSQIADMVLEDPGFTRNNWTVTEIINYINDRQTDFLLETQILKKIACIPSVTGQRIYDTPADTMELDRIAFANVGLERTRRVSLDRENRKWRTMPGVPRQYHEDQLTREKFETDRAPTSAMTGTGYTATGDRGLLRRMSGSHTYSAAPGSLGFFRYSYGSTAYNGQLQRGSGGMLRRMWTGLTNFVIVATERPVDVAVVSETLTVPSYCTMYIKYGVLEKMLSKEGERQDLARAKYCGERYKSGIRLFQRLIKASEAEVGANG